MNNIEYQLKDYYKYKPDAKGICAQKVFDSNKDDINDFDEVWNQTMDAIIVIQTKSDYRLATISINSKTTTKMLLKCNYNETFKTVNSEFYGRFLHYPNNYDPYQMETIVADAKLPTGLDDIDVKQVEHDFNLKRFEVFKL